MPSSGGRKVSKTVAVPTSLCLKVASCVKLESQDCWVGVLIGLSLGLCKRAIGG